MTRHLALLLLSAIIATSMEMKETVQRMVMVRTTGSDLEPETKGIIYKRESDGPAKVINMEKEEVMEAMAKMYEFPQAFYAPIPYAAGPFYNKDIEEDSDKAGSNGKEHIIIPVFENGEESSESKQDIIIPPADEDRGIYSEDSPFLEDYANDFNDYLSSLGYHDDFYRGGSWSEYGKPERRNIKTAQSAPHQYIYKINNDEHAKDYTTEKYAIYTLSSNHKNPESDLSNENVYKYDAEVDKTGEKLSGKYDDDFRHEQHVRGFDRSHKSWNSAKDPTIEEKSHKHHKNVDSYEYKKDDDDIDSKTKGDSGKKFSDGYDYVEPHVERYEEDRDDGDRAVALDLHGQVADELRDCCYEEKPKQSRYRDGINVERGSSLIYKLGHRQ